SAERWDRHRGYPAEGSPACFRYPASARGFPDRRRRADIARHRTSPVCHPAARLSPPWSNLLAPRCPAAGPVAPARNCWRMQAAPFEPAGSPASAAPAPSPARSPSVHSRRRADFLSACGETAGACGCSAPNPDTRSGFAIADQRKMAHRRHRTALDQGDTAVSGRPVDQSHPWKFRPPAEPARQRRKRQFEGTPRATLGTDVIDQDEFAAVLEHAYKIVKRRLGIRHRGDDVLRHHCVKKTILEGKILGVHDRERLDVTKIQ